MPLRIVHTESSMGWGGQEIRTLSEAAGLIDRGYSLSLLCPVQATLFKAAQARRIPVQAIPIGRKHVRGLWAIYRWLKQHPVDLIVTHSSTDSWLIAVASRLLPRRPTIIRMRHISTPVSGNTATRWLYTQGCDHVVTTGKALRDTLIQHNRFPAERISSVPTGIDLAHFVPPAQPVDRRTLGLPQTGEIIGIVATLRNWKGHLHLLEAFAALQRPNTHLLFVGDGPQRAKLTRLAKEHGVTSRLTMAGNQDNVVPWLQACDLFALPSYASEGVPQSLMQAMACGVPVISTPVGSIEEIVQDHVTGLLVPPKNSTALCHALTRLLDDATLRHTLRHNALQAARTRFSLDLMLDRMEQIIHQTHTARS